MKHIGYVWFSENIKEKNVKKNDFLIFGLLGKI